MSIITASKISRSYAAVTVLADVSFNINKGDRIGLIGANGAGKSTLIKMLAGELEPDGGELFVSSEASVGYLKQRDHFPGGGTVEEQMLKAFEWQINAEKELESLSKRMASPSPGDDLTALAERYDSLHSEFAGRRGYSFRNEMKGVLTAMGFGADDLGKSVDLLSGGELTRLALAALLLREPDVLLLDEPTNHLDIGTLKWLENYLRGYKGTLVVISHDRYFLDRIVTRIFELENLRLTVYEGNYSEYKEKKRLRYEEDLKHYRQQVAEIERQEEIIRRFKGHGTEHLVKRAKSREMMLSHMEKPEKPVWYADELKIRFSEKLQSGNDVVYAEGLSKSFGGRLLFSDANLDIKKGDRICIVGANGIGKTTLLRILLGEEKADSGFIRLGQNVIPGYYDQGQQLLHPELSVIEELAEEYPLLDRQVLRNLLGGFLFRGDDVFKTVADLSGGEKARLSLLKLMMSGANLLIMDEPTNHLDISAKEVFEDAVMAFPGTVIIVSHDRYLLQRVPTAICELTAGGITRYPGKYDYYIEKTKDLPSGKAYVSGLAARAEATAAPLSDKERRARERLEQKAREADARRRERLLLAAEQRVEKCEEEVKRTEESLCMPEVFSDPEKAAAASRELEAAKAALDLAYGEWMELQQDS